METKLQHVKTIVGKLCDETYDDDTFGIHEMLIDITAANIEVIMKFRRHVMPKIQSMATAFTAVKLDLDAAKQELGVKEVELKNAKICSNCLKIEKELAVIKKKQAINESRIKSIAKILTHVSGTEDSQDTDDDNGTSGNQSAVTRAYNLVSQMLGCEPLPSIESECEETEKAKTGQKQFNKKSPSSNENIELNSSIIQKPSPKTNYEEKEDSEDDILVCSLEEVDEEIGFETYFSPKKRTECNKYIGSPVLGKMKKTPVRNATGLSPDIAGHKRNLQSDRLEEHGFENSFCNPVPSGNIKNSRSTINHLPSIQPVVDKDDVSSDLQTKIIQSGDDKLKKTADFWQLKATYAVDRYPAKKESTKLRQSKLSVGFHPKKIDLCDLKEFNGGIRRSQTSTQISDKNTQENASNAPKINVAVRSANANDDDIVMGSPDTNVSNSRRKGGRLFSLGRKLSYDANGAKIPGSREISKSLSGTSDNQKDLSKNAQGSCEEANEPNKSFDCLKKGPASPKYKYRGSPIRKKSERQQLSGWDCENCRKYFEAAGGDASEEALKKIMNRCSRHRDKNPVRPRTPPGFWDAEFPASPDCADLDKTHMDILPNSKRQKMKQ